MRRIQFVELEDLPWFPSLFRDALTDALRFGVEFAGGGRLLARHLAPRIQALGATDLVDLCSGGGGPTASVVRALREQGAEVRATLTDKYPNLRAFEALSRAHGDAIGYRKEPVDATRVPHDLRGLRLVFNAFHHLPPEVARGVLRDAMESGQPIAVYEMIGREPFHLLGMIGAPLLFAASFPLMRPFDWRRVPFTYLLPVLPLVCLWDGMVSIFRIYDPEELAELVAPLQKPGWRWEIGRIRHGWVPAHATYLLGYPEPGARSEAVERAA